jgi:hypothetical protein
MKEHERSTAKTISKKKPKMVKGAYNPTLQERHRRFYRAFETKETQATEPHEQSGK